MKQLFAFLLASLANNPECPVLVSIEDVCTKCPKSVQPVGNPKTDGHLYLRKYKDGTSDTARAYWNGEYYSLNTIR